MTCHEGQYCENKIPITGGIYDIPQRLKEIDPRYFVMFNKSSQRYEVHVDGQYPSTYGCTLPFDELDARALHYVRENASSRTVDVAREIDRHNEQTDKRREAAFMDKANYKLKEAARYLADNIHTDLIPKELINE